MLRAAAIVLALALSVPTALALTDGRPGLPERAEPREAAEILIAATRTYRIVNAFPYTVEIKVHGNGPSFPHVVKVPPGGLIAIPFPDLSMKIQVRVLTTTTWSPMLTVPWRSGNISVPAF